MDFGLLAPHPQYRRVARLVRIAAFPSRALLSAIEGTDSFVELCTRLRGFYGANAEMLETSRTLKAPPAQAWAAMLAKLEPVGGGGVLPDAPIPLAQRSWLMVDAIADRLKHFHRISAPRVLIVSARAELQDVIDHALLAQRDPRRGARQWVSSLLTADRGDPLHQRLLEGAIEICSGPDPIIVDVELLRSTADIFDHGVSLVTPDDQLGAVTNVSFALGDSLKALAASCLDAPNRKIDADDEAAYDQFLEQTEEIGRAAADLGQDGLMVALIRNESLG